MLFAASIVTLLAATTAIAQQGPGASLCNNFTLPANLTGVTIAVKQYFPAGALVNFTSNASSITTTNLTAFCRLALLITTNATSGNYANTEVWLPDAWNNRLLGFGNGGWNGGIVYSSLSFDGANRGFASFSTNTGHNSSSLDGSWGVDKNAVTDFAYRALRVSTLTAKSITQVYYGTAQNKTYYLGCSTAGRMGLKAAQMFPEDFDAIVVGSPANRMSRLQPWSIRQYNLVAPVNASSWISSATWSVIHDEVLRQCDGLDGVRDGVLEDPYACAFRPETLTCSLNATNTTACLTIPQIAAVRNLYRPYLDGNNTYVFASYAPGGELSYRTGLVGPTIFSISPDFYKYFVWNDTTWDYRNLNITDILKGDAVNPGNMDLTSPNLTSFVNRGGKVLHYVGMGDQLIAAGNSIDFYNSVDAFNKANTNTSTTDFYRLFRIPGMAHCNGGDGANGFGGQSQRSGGTPPLADDVQHDVLRALIAWVEQGQAPNSVTGVRWNNNNASQGVAYTRKFCPYPQKAIFNGGNDTDASSFSCA